MPQQDYTEIAQIHERRSGGGGGAAMFAIGGVFMLLGLFDGSAIRLAAYAAIWTGWNVLSAAVLWSSTTMTYVVVRTPPNAAAGYEATFNGYPYLRLPNGAVRVLTANGPIEYKSWEDFYRMANSGEK